jgi:hypothetical protein
MLSAALKVAVYAQQMVHAALPEFQQSSKCVPYFFDRV